MVMLIIETKKMFSGYKEIVFSVFWAMRNILMCKFKKGLNGSTNFCYVWDTFRARAGAPLKKIYIQITDRSFRNMVGNTWRPLKNVEKSSYLSKSFNPVVFGRLISLVVLQING